MRKLLTSLFFAVLAMPAGAVRLRAGEAVEGQVIVRFRSGMSRQAASHKKSVLVYPNPFYPEDGQQVRIVLPADDSASARRLRIYTLEGAPVYDRDVLSLPVRWDGRNNDGRRCASGLYFFYLETNGGKETGKITLVR